ncbi:potassium-transporting ATPase subunit KdpC [Halomonas sp. McH1-25]|uniref:potassium-transporting ATPase subunit KdpC n=1 Tax=unclassified Halomonas TaxID=2609666 RepID=UPI001EF72C8D|nr:MULTISPECIES: potassium-transporting ATPase subunit KdpC [unclassified Halomonas]MCG7601477.1 potassium-transporting ATPase subunit KdpC [Halomonas sp. McH1-25]MCP1344291.1 potassium-transporting ATPase subunit KdpC [Halomonas sp. FL8]MCP1363420.1 potassium-transporting ATPase subunit KdpC [Halomonas sp. BBD45]MCP1365452.1 potassium-transporting ATPase subunit KdpC [Halomonas sp. BBD48]
MNTSLMTRTSLLASLRLMVVLAVLLGLLYPFVVTTLSGLLFPHQASGSLLYDSQGNVVGSTLVGQPFLGAQYFHGRPSAADYAPDAAAGSNLAPSNPVLRERTLDEVRTLQERDGLSAGEIPVDLLAASGSGIDPHITPAAALAQAPRVSQARGLPLPAVENAIQAATEYTGLLGEPAVNVLRLNLALNERALNERSPTDE